MTLLCVGLSFYVLNIIQKLKPRGYSDPEVVLLTTKIEEPGGFLKTRRPGERRGEKGGKRGGKEGGKYNFLYE